MFQKPKSAVMYIAGITIAIFILQLMIEPLTGYLVLTKDILSKPWMLVTHLFAHGGVGHIFWNMYALVMFGGLVEQRIGWKRFLTLYFGAGIIAGFVSSFFYSSALGASGAIMGVMAVLIVLMPKLRVLFFFAIPMPFWIAGVVWIALDTLGIFFPSGVGNIAHLVGMAVGFLYGFYLLSQRKQNKRNIASKTHLSKEDIETFISKGRI